MVSRIRQNAWLTGLLSFMVMANSQLPGQPGLGPQILQIDKKVIVDGRLEEWEGMPVWPVTFLMDGTRLEASPDLAVRCRFAFDAGYFYGAVEVSDNRLDFPSRGSLFGDSLFLSFIEPSEPGERASFIVFGFTLLDGQATGFVANRDGVPFPQAFTKDIQLEIVVDPAKKSFVAEVAVPWVYVPFFRPLLQPRWGINLEYVDIDAGKRKVAQLVADPNSGKAFSKNRRSQVFEFAPRLPNVPEFQALLNANHFYLDSERKIRLAIHSPFPQEGWRLTKVLSSARGSEISREGLAFDQGLTVREFPIDFEKPVTGLYDLSLGIVDDTGVLKFTEDHQFFLVARDELEACERKTDEVLKKEVLARDEVFRESLPTLKIRCQWIGEFMTEAPAFAPFDLLRQWVAEMNELLGRVEEGKPALFATGRVVRLAYQDRRHGRLRPYAAFIPEWSDSSTPLPLLVSLGGGPDGEQALRVLAAAYYGPAGKKRAGDLILLAPELDDSSDWLTEEAGQAVIDSIAHLKKLYRIDEKSIILVGSGSGAYEALRLALLNPDMFLGIIGRMGLSPLPAGSRLNNLLDLPAKVKSQNILIVQGRPGLSGQPDETSAAEESARLSDIRAFVHKLRELGMNVELIEIKFGREPQQMGWSTLSPEDFGPVDLSAGWEEMASWLKDILGKTAVFLKPPKSQTEKEPKKDKPESPVRPGLVWNSEKRHR